MSERQTEIRYHALTDEGNALPPDADISDVTEMVVVESLFNPGQLIMFFKARNKPDGHEIYYRLTQTQMDFIAGYWKGQRENMMEKWEPK
jgi:hypothetical protein